MKYVYQAETFSTARRVLMLPHPRGEQDSIARAFHECRLGLDDLDRDGLDENARERVKRLEELMATAGFSDANRVGGGRRSGTDETVPSICWNLRGEGRPHPAWQPGGL